MSWQFHSVMSNKSAEIQCVHYEAVFIHPTAGCRNNKCIVNQSLNVSGRFLFFNIMKGSRQNPSAHTITTPVMCEYF